MKERSNTIIKRRLINVCRSEKNQKEENKSFDMYGQQRRDEIMNNMFEEMVIHGGCDKENLPLILFFQNMSCSLLANCYLIFQGPRMSFHFSW